MFKNNIDHPSLFELWICLFLKTSVLYTSFEFMRHTITLILCTFIYFVLVNCYNLCSTSDIFSNKCKPNICSSCSITLIWCSDNVNWIVGHLTQDRQGNSVTCSVGCTTVALLLQKYTIFRFLYIFGSIYFLPKAIFLWEPFFFSCLEKKPSS